MILYNSHRISERPASEARLRAMARQMESARFFDLFVFQEMAESTIWLKDEDLDRLHCLRAESTRQA